MNEVEMGLLMRQLRVVFSRIQEGLAEVTGVAIKTIDSIEYSSGNPSLSIT